MKQQKFFSNFLGLDKFRKHLNKYHCIGTSLNIEFLEKGYSLPNTDVIPIDIVNKSNYVSDKNSENEIKKDFKDIVTSSVLNFIVWFYSKPNVTATLLQNIIDEVNKLFSN